MTNEEIVLEALNSAGDLDWKIKHFKDKKDIGILRVEGHPPYLRLITWRKRGKRTVFNIEVFLVPADRRHKMRLVVSHKLEV